MPNRSSERKKLTPAEARDLDAQIEFIEGLVRRDPDYVDALQLLGDHYTRRGRFQEGLGVDERLMRLDPQNPLTFYNLACSCALTQQFDRAAAALDAALNLGYRDFRWLARDPDLREFRKHPAFQRVQEKIQRLKIAVG